MQGTERLYHFPSLRFSSLLSTIRGVLERRNGTLVDGVLSGVPLGHLALLLELGKLPAVVDGGEQLPDEQQGQADEDDAQDHAQDDGHYVHRLRALPFVLGSYSVLIRGLQLVDEGVLAVVFIPEDAELLTFLIDFDMWCLNGQELAFGLAVLLIVRSELEDLAQHTVLECLTLARASRTVLAEVSTVPFFIRLEALALATDTVAVAAADFPIGANAGVVGVSAVAVWTSPAVVTLALPADTAALFVTSAKLSVDPVTGEVVTLAVLSAYGLLSVFSRMALADSTATLSSPEARLGVVWEEAALLVLDLISVLGVTFTLPAVAVVVAAADATLKGAHPT